MPSIHITRKHGKSLADARTAIDKVAKSIAKKFSVEYGWDGNTLNFERAGVSGHIALSKGLVKVSVEISFLLLAIKSAIETEIEKHLDRELG
jgi:putative polyhydroxyalkanoate system protein